MLLASSLFKACAIELNDVEYVRWTKDDLAEYLTDAISVVAALKPTLFTVFEPIQLAPGAVQTVPGEFTELIDIPYNLHQDGTHGEPVSKGSFTAARALGRNACTPVNGADYVVRSYTVHPENDTYFIVDPPVPQLYPGPMPFVWALLQRAPNIVVSEADTVAMANTTPETYRSALLEWMLYRAFARDTESSDSFQRSQAHYKAFYQFLGLPPRDKDAVPVAAKTRETVSGAANQ
jgi:hypothetical protein